MPTPELAPKWPEPTTAEVAAARKDVRSILLSKGEPVEDARGNQVEIWAVELLQELHGMAHSRAASAWAVYGLWRDGDLEFRPRSTDLPSIDGRDEVSGLGRAIVVPDLSNPVPFEPFTLRTTPRFFETGDPVRRKVRQFRDELAALDCCSREAWVGVVQKWQTRFRLFLRRFLPHHLDEFEHAYAEPRWTRPRSSLRELANQQAPAESPRIQEENRRLGESARGGILAYLDGLLELEELESAVATERRTAPAAKSNKVFVVHGHDAGMKEAVARTLERLGLEPIILHEQPNEGRTIIERFEAHSDVGFAVVLLSPDDMAYPRDSVPNAARPRARQNVILELGYFIGRLARQRVCAVRHDQGDLEVPSDYHGVIYVPYDAAGAWRTKLAQELQQCGYEIDLNKLKGLV